MTAMNPMNMNPMKMNPMNTMNAAIVAELTQVWAKNHREGRWQANAFVRGLLALKTGGPGTMTSLRPSECAPWEEAALAGGLILGARSAYAAVDDLPEEVYPFPAGFDNAALGRVLDVLTDAFGVPDYDLEFCEIQDALDRAGLFGVGLLEMDTALLTDLARCAGPVFDFEAMTARADGVRVCALAVRSARRERIRARDAAYRGKEGDEKE